MKALAWAQRNGVLVAFLVLFAACSLWKPEFFLQPENLRNIVNQNVPVGILAVAMTLVIIAGGIDLSVGSMMGLVGVFTVLTLNHLMGNGTPETTAVTIACFAALVYGGLLGTVNGVVITVGRVTPFIATLGGLVAYRSIGTGLTDAGEVRSASSTIFQRIGMEGIPLFGLKTNAGAPILLTYPMIAFVLVALVAAYLLNKTRFGRYCVAVGSNEQAARYSAIPVERVRLLTYTLMGVAAGIASLGLAARMNSVSSSQTGIMLELDAIAAAVIGGTRLSGGFGRIGGTVIGVMMLAVISNILVVAGIGNNWQGCVKGAIIVIAVLIQRPAGRTA